MKTRRRVCCLVFGLNGSGLDDSVTAGFHAGNGVKPSAGEGAGLHLFWIAAVSPEKMAGPREEEEGGE